MFEKIKNLLSYRTTHSEKSMPLEFYAVKNEGEIIKTTLSNYKQTALNSMPHSWWIERGSKAEVVKLKLVEE